MTRRKVLALLGVFAIVAVAVSLISVSPLIAQQPTKHSFPPTPSWWTGYNAQLDKYYVDPGYPPYAAHPRYLGELSGSWHNIGKQYGERAGDLIRLTFEGWYRELVATQGSPENIIAYVHQEEAYYKNLVPEALELMKGIADGAKQDLDQSVYAGVMTNFEKIVMINSYFGLQGRPPVAQMANASRVDDPIVTACSGAVIFGGATKDKKLIHVSSEDQHFFPQEYLVTFVVNPSDKRAHRYTVTDTAGEIGSEQAINDHGVVVSGYAGGGVNIASPTLAAPFSGYRRAGLDWQVGDWYAVAFADTAKKAVELLTVGTPEYRKKSGNKIVIGKCSKGANWVVSDLTEAYVVESIPADQNGIARYAVRKPGDMGEKNASYIVSTNNVEATYSCDENNVCDTSHPMNQHGKSDQNPGAYLGLTGSGMRFWTLMWLTNNNYGNITLDMTKEWRTAHYVYDMAGTKYDYLTVGGKEVSPHLVPSVGTMCRHTVSSSAPGVDTFTGINIYVSISTPDNLTIYRTKGRPCEWVGPWDALSLLNVP